MMFGGAVDEDTFNRKATLSDEAKFSFAHDLHRAILGKPPAEQRLKRLRFGGIPMRRRPAEIEGLKYRESLRHGFGGKKIKGCRRPLREGRLNSITPNPQPGR